MTTAVQENKSSKHIFKKSNISILIAGGYGTVGTVLSELISIHYPEIHVIIGGRRLHKAQSAARLLPKADGVRIDILDADPLADMKYMPDAIIVSVNDQEDRLLRAAVKRGIPLIDITRWIERIDDAHAVVAEEKGHSPVVLASGWMASAATIAASSILMGKEPAENIDIDILLSLKDKSGLDSFAHFVDAHLPFEIWEKSNARTVLGFSDPKTVTFSREQVFQCRRISSPESMTLVSNGLAKGVSIRLAFDSRFTNRAFAALVNCGIWARLSLKRRTSILHSSFNTSTAPQEFILSIKTNSKIHRIRVTDPLGQAHLTAASTLTQLERIFELNGRISPKRGVSFPEEATDTALDIATMTLMGVQFTEI
ncbi:hypothetical protein [Paenibacillus sp. sgz500992]|uniref:hypothetical protein n=1 Tax=Paenibacillus sp. sgz500992 TaxID=3242476 RepID=UPI0036D33262